MFTHYLLSSLLLILLAFLSSSLARQIQVTAALEQANIDI
jgi:hypothetical protein